MDRQRSENTDTLTDRGSSARTSIGGKTQSVGMIKKKSRLSWKEEGGREETACGSLNEKKGGGRLCARK